MAYFGGGGIAGRLHPSLKVYIDCFLSPPFPKVYPRGGGIWDQDPNLMRDFRSIREFEIQWKNSQEGDSSPLDNDVTGGGTDLEGLLNQMLEDRGLGDSSGYDF